MTDIEKTNLASRIMSGIEFVGDQNRCDEITSIYRYLGLNSNLVASIALVSDRCYKFNMYKKNEGIYVSEADVNFSQDVRMKMPCHNIGITDEYPTEFMHYLSHIEFIAKKKFDIVNNEVVDNRKRINNAKKNLNERVELVEDFLGTGKKLVSDREFKAYITGLSVRNHRLKKKAKILFSKYMLIHTLKDFILFQCVGDDKFHDFCEEYIKICKKYKDEE